MYIEEKNFLSENLKEIERLCLYYQIDKKQIERFKVELETFSIRIPLVGSFSAGKSSLINFLLKKKILETNIDPETSLPVEIKYSKDEKVNFIQPKKPNVSLSLATLSTHQFRNTPENSLLEISAPFQVLKNIPEITIVDLPGWSSGIDRHSESIDNYLWRSSAYCLVVSVDEGGLKDTLKLIIEELALNKKPMMLVITKADKKTTDEVSKVSLHIKREVENITNSPLLSVSIVGRNNTSEFEDSLNKLVTLNEKFFHGRIGNLAAKIAYDLKKILTKLLNENNFTIDDIKDQKIKVSQQKNKLRDDVKKIQRQLSEEICNIKKYILDDFNCRLKYKLEDLASAVINNNDVSLIVGQALRMAYTNGINNRLKPLIINKLHKLKTMEIEPLEDLNISYEYSANSKENDFFSFFFDVIKNIVNEIPIPSILKKIILNVLSIFSSKEDEEKERLNQIEEARLYVLNSIIPDCMEKVDDKIDGVITSSIKNIIDNISAEIDQEIENYQNSLNQLEQELNKEVTADEENKLRIKKELHYIDTLLTKLNGYENE